MALTPLFSSKSASALGLAAALSMAAMPAQAAELPAAPANAAVTGSPLTLMESFDTTTHDGNSDVRQWRRGWHRYGYRRHRRHHGVDAGDVLAGVAIIGGIAAIASAANNNRRRDRDVVVVERDGDRYDERDAQRDREIEELRRRSDEQQREIEYLRSRGLDASRLSGSQARSNVLPPVSAPLTIDGAIDRCSEVVGIDAQVNGIDGVDRTGTGWSVRGRTADGQTFSCDIGSDGQIQRLSNNGFSSYQGNANDRPALSSQRAEGQWSDNRYADARGSLSSQRYAASDARVAYPGGPVPGQYGQ